MPSLTSPPLPSPLLFLNTLLGLDEVLEDRVEPNA